jgi:hypothetical protein
MHIYTKVANFAPLFLTFSKLILPKIVYNAVCQHFLKARAHDHGLEPFLSLSKIAKRLEPSIPDPRIRSTTSSQCLVLILEEQRK